MKRATAHGRAINRVSSVEGVVVICTLRNVGLARTDAVATALATGKGFKIVCLDCKLKPRDFDEVVDRVAAVLTQTEIRLAAA